MNSSGVIGVTMICSIVPISFSRTTAILVSMSVMSITTIAITPGTQKLRLSKFSLNQVRDCSLTRPGLVNDPELG